ncbi:hypothetical protein SCP_0206410 [Sparassis crispa]|uniref:Uncharacterized protein n=1 Tax=Sparassis crispa TaxID=139825 RepID=A0A401GBA4_9APHY|nr:hypothetical protein SCP_0206410 [Sparassis crispa]GBE79442.1 hypothetical protein SCP_0206410 [Sparassis crispa]
MPNSEYVDNKLSTVQTFHKDDAKKISKMFAQILEDDRTNYGQVNIEEHTGAAGVVA